MVATVYERDNCAGEAVNGTLIRFDTHPLRLDSSRYIWNQEAKAGIETGTRPERERKQEPE